MGGTRSHAFLNARIIAHHFPLRRTPFLKAHTPRLLDNSFPCDFELLSVRLLRHFSKWGRKLSDNAWATLVSVRGPLSSFLSLSRASSRRPPQVILQQRLVSS